MQNLEEVLGHYGIKGKVAGVCDGPVIRQIAFEPEAGTKLKNILAAEDDIARELGVSALRVEPIDGSRCLGFEIPEEEMRVVDFAAILKSDAFAAAKGELPICLGVDVRGDPFFADLAKMPHLLVAGTTGSGKSVGLNTFVLSLIVHKTPQELKLVMIDPKRIEFGVYNHQKYMLYPVVTDNAEASAVLQELIKEMERRYVLLEENMTKNIGEYHRQGGRLPYIVCVIDEFADLTMADKNAGAAIQRLAQKARAAGIHIILATQRPSVDVVTGVVKANFPTRLSYKVTCSFDSRTVLDMPGAEKLLGRGDALFLMSDGTLKRIHGAYADDEEIAAMLAPFRGEVKPFSPTFIPKLSGQPETREQTNTGQPGFWHRALNFWSGLRQREKKTIVSGIFYLFGVIFGSVRKKK